MDEPSLIRKFTFSRESNVNSEDTYENKDLDMQIDNNEEFGLDINQENNKSLLDIEGNKNINSKNKKRWRAGDEPVAFSKKILRFTELKFN